jgi:hypothetical protein
LASTGPGARKPTTPEERNVNARQRFLTDPPLAGDVVAEDFDGWPAWLKTEFDEHANDGHVGSRLLVLMTHDNPTATARRR